jgi:predicted DNA-binding transcriptional regulator YafY
VARLVTQITLDGAAWVPPQPTDPLALQVLIILQDGRTHGRHSLSAEVGANVREVRRAVSELRQLGWPIGFGVSGGYRLSWATEDLDVLEAKYRRQALSELRTLRRIRRARQNRVA